MILSQGNSQTLCCPTCSGINGVIREVIAPRADYIAGQSPKLKKGALQHVNGYLTGSDLSLNPSYLLCKRER